MAFAVTCGLAQAKRWHKITTFGVYYAALFNDFLLSYNHQDRQ